MSSMCKSKRHGTFDTWRTTATVPVTKYIQNISDSSIAMECMKLKIDPTFARARLMHPFIPLSNDPILSSLSDLG